MTFNTPDESFPVELQPNNSEPILYEITFGKSITRKSIRVIKMKLGSVLHEKADVTLPALIFWVD